MSNREKSFGIVLLLIFIGYNVSSQTLTIKPIKDTEISTYKPSKAYGSDTYFSITSSNEMVGNYQKRSHALFSFSTERPEGKVLKKATLMLYNPNYDNIGDTKFYIKRCSDNWMGEYLTWNNSNVTVFQDRIITVPETNSTDPDFEIDVTKLMSESGTKDLGYFYLDMPTLNYAYFNKVFIASKEHSDSSKHPQLVLEYQVPNNIKFTSEKNGSLIGDTIQYIADGHSSSSVLAIPKKGYWFKEWVSDDGSHYSVCNPLFIHNVVENKQLKAIYTDVPIISKPAIND